MSKIIGTFKGAFKTGMKMIGLILSYRIKPDMVSKHRDGNSRNIFR
jgi:hypothetical protein